MNQLVGHLNRFSTVDVERANQIGVGCKAASQTGESLAITVLLFDVATLGTSLTCEGWVDSVNLKTFQATEHFQPASQMTIGEILQPRTISARVVSFPGKFKSFANKIR